jgi:uncharacterized OsmC-like protein
MTHSEVEIQEEEQTCEYVVIQAKKFHFKSNDDVYNEDLREMAAIAKRECSHF